MTMPGNIFMDSIKTGKLLSKQNKDGVFQRYDIIAKYLFVKEFYDSGKDASFDFPLYNRMAEANGRKGKFKSFLKLIKSFEKHGFKEEFPFIIKDNLYMCGGSHRMACCLWFDIKRVPIKFHDNPKKKSLFNEKWMAKHGFEEVLPSLKKERKRIFEYYGYN
jgi:hypothetical protein